MIITVKTTDRTFESEIYK